MKKFILSLCMAIPALVGFAQEQNCMPESVYADSAFNVEVARVIYKKFATSNSPLFKGKYLRQVATSNFEEKQKDGKVIYRDIDFLVAKQNDKGECKLMKFTIRQEFSADGKWGKPIIQSFAPSAGSPDCNCVLAKKDWYKP